MLISDAHWVIKLLHLLVGVAAMGQAEGLAARIMHGYRRLKGSGGREPCEYGHGDAGGGFCREHVPTVRRLLRALVEGDAVGADAFVSPDYLDHDAPGAGNSPPRRGSAQFRESVQWVHRVFADVEFEEQEVIAADDRVVVRVVMRARQVGRLLGIEPAGQQVEVPQMHIFRLAGGKVAEHRAVWAELNLLLQLGAVPLAVNAAKCRFKSHP